MRLMTAGRGILENHFSKLSIRVEHGTAAYVSKDEGGSVVGCDAIVALEEVELSTDAWDETGTAPFVCGGGMGVEVLGCKGVRDRITAEELHIDRTLSRVSTSHFGLRFDSIADKLGP